MERPEVYQKIRESAQEELAARASIVEKFVGLMQSGNFEQAFSYLDDVFQARAEMEFWQLVVRRTESEAPASDWHKRLLGLALSQLLDSNKRLYSGGSVLEDLRLRFRGAAALQLVRWLGLTDHTGNFF